MKITEMRTKSDKELFTILDSLKADLLALRFRLATGQIEKTHELKEIKRDIARVYTVMFENKNNPIDNEEEIKGKKTEKSSRALKKEKKKSEKKSKDLVVEEKTKKTKGVDK